MDPKPIPLAKTILTENRYLGVVGAVGCGLVVAVWVGAILSIFSTEAGIWPLVAAFVVAGYLKILTQTIIIHGTSMYLSGETPYAGSAIKRAIKKTPNIFGWFAVISTLGTIASAIENSSRTGSSENLKVRALSFIGERWSAAKLVAVPAVMLDDHSSWSAPKHGSRLLREKWGINISTHGSFTLRYFVGFLPAVAWFVVPLILTRTVGGEYPHMPTSVFLAVPGVYLLILWSTTSTLYNIYQTAIYLYATDRSLLSGHGSLVPPFPVQALHDTITLYSED